MMVFEEISKAEREFLEGLERSQELELPILGSSGHGKVYDLNGKALKMYTPHTGRVLDAINLLPLKGLKGVPKLYAFEPKKWVLMEAVYGERLDTLREIPKGLRSKIYYLAVRARGRGVELRDFKLENFILRDGRPVFIDYGHCRLVPKPNRRMDIDIYGYYHYQLEDLMKQIKQNIEMEAGV